MSLLVSRRSGLSCSAEPFSLGSGPQPAAALPVPRAAARKGWGRQLGAVGAARSSNPSEGKRRRPHARSRCGWREAKRLLTKGNGLQSRAASCWSGRIPVLSSLQVLAFSPQGVPPTGSAAPGGRGPLGSVSCAQSFAR